MPIQRFLEDHTFVERIKNPCPTLSPVVYTHPDHRHDRHHPGSVTGSKMSAGHSWSYASCFRGDFHFHVCIQIGLFLCIRWFSYSCLYSNWSLYLYLYLCVCNKDMNICKCEYKTVYMNGDINVNVSVHIKFCWTIIWQPLHII